MWIKLLLLLLLVKIYVSWPEGWKSKQDRFYSSLEIISARSSKLLVELHLCPSLSRSPTLRVWRVTVSFSFPLDFTRAHPNNNTLIFPLSILYTYILCKNTPSIVTLFSFLSARKKLLLPDSLTGASNFREGCLMKNDSFFETARRNNEVRILYFSKLIG